MKLYVPKDRYYISQPICTLIAERQKKISSIVNKRIWDGINSSEHCKYIGAYGRGTAISEKIIDLLLELPVEGYGVTTKLSIDQLAEMIRKELITEWVHIDIRTDDHHIRVNFLDGMTFQILSVMKKRDWYGNDQYIFSDNDNMNNILKRFNPRAEQEAMLEENKNSGGLLLDTCKHIRYLRDTYFSREPVSDDIIDAFSYSALKNWERLNPDGRRMQSGAYEESILEYWNNVSWNGTSAFQLRMPGSQRLVAVSQGINCLGAIIKLMT